MESVSVYVCFYPVPHELLQVGHVPEQSGGVLPVTRYTIHPTQKSSCNYTGNRAPLVFLLQPAPTLPLDCQKWVRWSLVRALLSGHRLSRWLSSESNLAKD
ncbi:hypothetical protein AVEN_118759-1 [Araneus ventricosus]|uniref:Uncharacterized protein n=1 Tax=Araneus ventricosus TaxID=182803 RepID=A0A4Y2BY28_ARAVE|nr:hypothetical protein AVEN_118759-1 [Araneus ventricosus]